MSQDVWHNSGWARLFSAPLDYSRKPGFTETRLRPLARRREITFLPPWVFMRTRNPCVFDRLRRLGWNVRLGKVARS
jgi:ribosomal protein L39E